MRADRLEQPRGDGREEVAAAGVRQEEKVLAGQGHQVVVRRLPVTERVAAKHLGDLFLARLRIEHQVHHGVGGRAVVVQKRVVKNVVEDAAIHLGLAAIVCQEAVRGDGPVFARSRRHVAHPDRQRPQLFQAPGHLVSLAVEKNLEPVLDPPKKAIGVIHDASFIGGEATDLFELVNGQQGIGAADLGILAAVQQLQKLDHELDVANSTVARLDLEIGASRPRPCAVRSAASAP